MPGYGILPADRGSGLIPWAEAERRLTVAHDYWCATVHPDGRPHVMPVWGVWLDGRLWFSSAVGSRKVRNLDAEPRCTLTTDDARDPVVVEGVAERVRRRRHPRRSCGGERQVRSTLTEDSSTRRSTRRSPSGRSRCSRCPARTSPAARRGGASPGVSR